MDKILKVKNLEVNFITNYGEIKAVRNVSFDLNKGEVLAIVGESGCGKSALCRSLLKLLPRNGYIKSGEILFKKNDLCKVSDEEMNKIRGNDISMIFQNPTTTLNPTINIGKQILEAIRIHNKINKVDAKKIVLQLMDLVGIDNVETRYNQYPYEFSGGMRQRVVIAISLANNPDVLIADEPTTDLDVVVQYKILNLIKSIQIKNNISIVLITHDLGVVANIADRVAVMYAGKIIEIGKKNEILLEAKHPYTKALLKSIPYKNKENSFIECIDGIPPNLLDPPKGDAFAIRNKNPLKIDFLEEPPMFKVTETHYAATWMLHPNAKKARETLNYE